MIPPLNYLVLFDALHALKEGNIRHCQALGFTFDEMNALSQLSLDEFFTLSRASAPFIDISIRHDVLHQLLTLCLRGDTPSATDQPGCPAGRLDCTAASVLWSYLQ